MNAEIRRLARVLGAGAAMLVLFVVLALWITAASRALAHPGSADTNSAEAPLAECTALESLEITGPITISVSTSHAFTATVVPGDATLPITYTWEASGYLSRTRSVEATSDVLTFTWGSTGTQVITVTATNACDSGLNQSDSLYVDVVDHRVYLAVVLDKNFPDPYEPNDSVTDAYGPLVSGQHYSAYIPQGDPDDYYFVEFSTLSPIHAELMVPPPLDLDLYVYDHGLKMVAWSNISGKGVDEIVHFNPTEVVTHYLRVYPYDGWSMSDAYLLTVTFDALERGWPDTAILHAHDKNPPPRDSHP